MRSAHGHQPLVSIPQGPIIVGTLSFISSLVASGRRMLFHDFADHAECGSRFSGESAILFEGD